MEKWPGFWLSNLYSVLTDCKSKYNWLMIQKYAHQIRTILKSLQHRILQDEVKLLNGRFIQKEIGGKIKSGKNGTIFSTIDIKFKLCPGSS
jgi:hypothetical protein